MGRVSDFGLMDAIESGIVKIPRVPVSDDSMTGEGPMYRDLWLRVRDALPRKGIKDTPIDGLPVIPKELEGALRSLYADYERSHEAWAEAGMGTPPVFIVVCSNTATSKLVADWIAGWEKDARRRRRRSSSRATSSCSATSRTAASATDRTRSSSTRRSSTAATRSTRHSARPPTRRSRRFKHEIVTRFPGRSADDITDEDILREVMNTVGKRGKLGEHIRCVVSVAMLTEGWDANTVTHILGIRAFGTQLLCEQVVGRALRRACYDADEDGMFEPEYAEVYGVPFSFLSVAGQGRVQVGQGRPRGPGAARAGGTADRVPAPRRLPLRDADRAPRGQLRRVVGARAVDPGTSRCETQLDPIVGEMELHKLDLRDQRMQTVEFAVAKRTLDNHFRDEEGGERPGSSRSSCASRSAGSTNASAVPKDARFPQMLLLAEYSHAAAEKIQRAIYAGTRGEKRLMPNLRPYEPIGSTDDVRFETTKTCFETTRATSTSSSRTRAGSRSWPRCSSRCPRSSPTPRTRG